MRVMVNDRDRLRARKAQMRDTNKLRNVPHPSSVVAVKQTTDHYLDATQHENLLAHVATLYVKGIPTNIIAQDVGKTQPEIMVMLDELKGRWRQSSLMDFTQRKAEELAKIDHLQQTYWDAWEKSQQNAIRQSTDEAFRSDGTRQPTKRKTEQMSSTGDVRFLDGVFKCIERRIKLIGLDADARHIVQQQMQLHGNGREHDLSSRMEYYASVLGFSLLPSADAPAGEHDSAKPVDSERPPPASSGLLDIIDADYRDNP